VERLEQPAFDTAALHRPEGLAVAVVPAAP
jgi:hypothetical protein